MSTIRTKPTHHDNRLSLSATPWAIHPDTEYIIQHREDADKYWLTNLEGRHVSFLLERDLLVLFDEEELFMANLCGIEKRER